MAEPDDEHQNRPAPTAWRRREVKASGCLLGDALGELRALGAGPLSLVQKPLAASGERCVPARPCDEVADASP